jgi:hypothetical protein
VISHILKDKSHHYVEVRHIFRTLFWPPAIYFLLGQQRKQILRFWTFRTPPLINSLTINSVFINRAEHHGFLFTTTKIRVVPDIPWCWEARLQWPSLDLDPQQILRYY